MTSILTVTLMPPDGQNSTSFTESLLRMVLHDANTAGHLIRGGGPMFLPASPNTLPEMRNSACKFLLDESEAEWLLFIDSDMGFAADAPYALLAAADPVERPVIGALCFGMRKAEPDGMGGFRSHPFPTLYDFKPNESGKFGFVLRYDYKLDTVQRVAATGAAFLLIHRTVLSQVREEFGDTWFDRGRLEPDEGLMGEDIAFCARVGRQGTPIFVHSGVKTTHLKPVWVGEEFYSGQRLLASGERIGAAE